MKIKTGVKLCINYHFKSFTKHKMKLNELLVAKEWHFALCNCDILSFDSRAFVKLDAEAKAHLQKQNKFSDKLLGFLVAATEI